VIDFDVHSHRVPHRMAYALARQHLAFLNVATRQVKSLADVLGQINLGLTISPDEQILLYSQLDHVNSDVMLVEHFR
jgi:hypothetical protein